MAPAIADLGEVADPRREFGGARAFGEQERRAQTGEVADQGRRTAARGNGVVLVDGALGIVGGGFFRGDTEAGQDGIATASVPGEIGEGGNRLLVLALVAELERRNKTLAARLRLAVLPVLPETIAGGCNHDQDGEADDIGSIAVPQPFQLLPP